MEAMTCKWSQELMDWHKKAKGCKNDDDCTKAMRKLRALQRYLRSLYSKGKTPYQLAKENGGIELFKPPPPRQPTSTTSISNCKALPANGWFASKVTMSPLISVIVIA
jgi:hypothetical protein